MAFIRPLLRQKYKLLALLLIVCFIYFRKEESKQLFLEPRNPILGTLLSPEAQVSANQRVMGILEHNRVVLFSGLNAESYELRNRLDSLKHANNFYFEHIEVEKEVERESVRGLVAGLAKDAALPVLYFDGKFYAHAAIAAEFGSDLHATFLKRRAFADAKFAGHELGDKLFSANSVTVFCQKGDDAAHALVAGVSPLFAQEKYNFGVHYLEPSIDQDLIGFLVRHSGQVQFPQVYTNGKYAGGRQLLAEFNASNLEKVLTEFGVKRARVIKPSPGGTDSLSALEHVKHLVAENTLMVFSKTYCPHCKAARRLLEAIDSKYVLKYQLMQLDTLEMTKQMEYKKALIKISGRGSVPNIFLNGKSLGGNSEIQGLHQSGKLIKIFEEANIISKRY